jgi:glucose dehydrogenase
MKTLRSITLLTILYAAGFCQAQSMFRGDAPHSGSYSGPVLRQFHCVRWKFATGDRIVSSPVIDNKKIYFGSDDGNVYAVDAETGRQIWKCATKGPVSSSPAVANGIVCATSYDGKLYALSSETGVVKWKFGTAGERRFEAKGYPRDAAQKSNNCRSVRCVFV